MTNENEKSSTGVKPAPFLKTPSEAARISLHYHRLTLLFVISGIVLGIAGFLGLLASERIATSKTFEQASVVRARAIQGEITRQTDIVAALGAFYDSSQTVTRDEFHTFAQHLLALAPGIQALEWIPRVTSVQRDYYETAARRAFPHFQIAERKEQGMVRAQQRGEYFPVYFVEPYARNEGALGFDLASSPARAATLRLACDSGAMVVSPRIKLVQEKATQFGILVIQPIYRKGAIIQTVEQRRANIVGFVLGVFRPGNFLDQAISGLPVGGLDIVLNDESAAPAERLLYFHPSRSRPARNVSTDVLPGATADIPRHVETINIGGRRWSLTSTPVPGHYSFTPSLAAWRFLLAGLIFSVLLASNIQLMRRRALAAISANDTLRESEARYKSLVDLSSDAYFEQDENLRFSQTTIAAHEIDPDEMPSLIGKARWDLPGCMPLSGSWADHQAILAARLPFRDFEVGYPNYAGRMCYTSISGAPLFGADGSFKGYHGLARDITAQKTNEQNIKNSEGNLVAAQRLAQIGSWTINLDGADSLEHGKLLWSDEIYRIVGYAPGEIEVSMESYVNLTHPADRESLLAPIKQLLANGGNYAVEHRIIRRDGSERFVLDKGEVFIDPSTGKSTKFVGTTQDITERKCADQQLTHLAQFDMLTGLPNRRKLYDQLDQTLANSQRSGSQIACMFIDLDRFKSVNDTFGHGVGDKLLIQAAERMQQCLRGDDVIGRLGGDEFAAVLTHLAKADDTSLVAQKMITALAAPFDVDGHEVFISASIGIAIYPDDGKDAGALLRNADTAMYRAKEQGRNNHQFYKAQMNERLAQHQQLETGLRGALKRQEFALHYQPKVELNGGAISGFEALLRWQHPERGLISPVEFIPVLEDTGLIVPVGEWVLRTVCNQIKLWQAQGLRPLPIALNLSARQFQSKTLDAFIAGIAESGIDPALIKLELTESLLMKDVDETAQSLAKLKSLGVRLSMDDFGTGYSSLSYLKRFPLDELKIDISFIRDVIINAEDAEITLAIINLAHSLKLKVVAEGVETEAQLSFLCAHGCDEIQGYYFSQPLNVEDCTRMQREGQRLNLPKLDDAFEEMLIV